MIKAVLWDLGDVLCRFHPDRRVREIARRSGASEDDVRALLTAELLGRLDAGDMTGDQLLAVVHAELGWHCTVAELGTAWAAAFEPDNSVLKLARRIVVPQPYSPTTDHRSATTIANSFQLSQRLYRSPCSQATRDW